MEILDNQTAHLSDNDFSIPVKSLTLSSVGENNLNITIFDLNPSNNTRKVVFSSIVSLYCIPGYLSLLPPLITLIISATISEVTVALISGVWAGATVVCNGNIFEGFLRTFDQYWVNAFTSDGHAGVLLFTFILGGTIGLVQKGGGGQGLADKARDYMTSRFRMQLCIWILCLLIFFDDYSCVLIIGSSLRSVIKTTGTSGEKFAAIIHSMGVSLASMAPVSSWIGVEIGYVTAQLNELNLDWDPFVTCLQCLQYRFFPILLILFILIIIIMQRDFGPMLTSEQEAYNKKVELSDKYQLGLELTSNEFEVSSSENETLEPKLGTPLRWFNAVIPFSVIVVMTFVGMIIDGYHALGMIPKDERPDMSLLNALSHSDSLTALIRSSAIGWLVALVLLLSQKILNISEAMKAWILGVKDVLDPTIVLLLAWALGNVIVDIQAAPYLSSLIQNDIDASYLPGISALLCYVVSFAIGSTFGTMAIMFPIVCPIAFAISNGNTLILRQCIGSILGGSTFGNTCSPIADTSILSSLSTHVPLTSHIRTVLPYSILVGLTALGLGSFPVGMGYYNILTSYILCVIFFIVFLLVFGKKIEHQPRFGSFSSHGELSPTEQEITPLIIGSYRKEK